MPEPRPLPEASESPLPSPELPVRSPGGRRPLPARVPDERRPKVQGLSPGASELRRRQASPGTSAPPSDAAHLAVLGPWSGTLTAVLRAVATEHPGYGSSLLCTMAGSPVAHHGLPEPEVAAAAAATSALYGTAAAAGPVDHVTVRLPDATSVVVTDAGTPHTPLLLRLGAGADVSAEAVRTVLARTVADLTASVHDAEAASRPARVPQQDRQGPAPASSQSASTSASAAE